MRNKIKFILNLFFTYPHYKMNVFSGTNSFKEVAEAIRSLRGNIVKGDSVEKYKVAFGRELASKSVYSFASGRMGFYSILESIGIDKGDEIIIPSFTCVVVPNAIIYSGASPVYCEVSLNDFNIDSSKIVNCITPKTKILYAQHTFGQMCDMDKIMLIAKKYNLIVIEDCALSMGAKYKGKFSGTIGDFGYYSSDRSKIINTGLGGIVSVNNKKYIKDFQLYYKNIPYLPKKYSKKIVYTFIANIITLHPNFYWIGKLLNFIFTRLGFMTYFTDELSLKRTEIKKYPYPAKMSNIISMIGLSQLKFFDKNLNHRKQNALLYNTILNIYTDEYMYSEKNVFLRYSFLVNNRDYWEQKFSSKIDLSIWFKSVVSGRTKSLESVGYAQGSNRVSEYACDHIINFPTHMNINVNRISKLLQELKESGDIITKERVL
jgi:perosamine synthetase